MLYTLNAVIDRIKDSIDSDDIVQLGAEIEEEFCVEEIILLKKMLTELSSSGSLSELNIQFVRQLNYYLSETDVRY